MTRPDRKPPTPQEANDLHRYSDADTTPQAIHHSLGRGPTQAAAGNHVHDGVNGELSGNYDTIKENGGSLPARPALNFKDAIEPNAGSVSVADDLPGSQTTVQFRAHDSPDTDTTPTALHHTLGTSSNQAAAGNHNHSGYADAAHTHPVSVGVLPFVSLRRVTAQSLLNNTWTSVSWDHEVEDTGTFWTSGNPTRLVAATAGLYTVTFAVSFDTSTVGTRYIRLMKNGSTMIPGRVNGAPTGDGLELLLVKTIRLALNDYIEAQAYQSSGAALNLRIATGTSPNFEVLTSLEMLRVSD